MDQYLFQFDSKPTHEYNFSDLLETDEIRLENSIFEEIPLSNKKNNSSMRRTTNLKNFQKKETHLERNQTLTRNKTTKRETEKKQEKKIIKLMQIQQLGNIKSKQIKSIQANLKGKKKAVSTNQETEQSPLKGASKVQQTKKSQPRKRGRTLKPAELKKRKYLSSIRKIDNVKDLTKEERRIRRLERNRESARRTREKKKIQEMRQQNEIARLQKLVEALQKEIHAKDEVVSKLSKLIPSDPISRPTNKRPQIIQISSDFYRPKDTNRNNEHDHNTTKTINTHPNNRTNSGGVNNTVLVNTIHSKGNCSTCVSKDKQSKNLHNFDLLHF
ncbi:camp-response element binding protein-related [Anaeramoeba flamelloides]|uniref:Camp-response element binding protein-related n=1 Tax=Anaeramoeba flamelloides TaxID=1746091 RepID=A0AAV7YM43_9EUKA|nr:camp-response element binding protein-related [Anaeramoeba flamelloides]